MSKTMEEDNSPTVVSKFPDRVDPDEESDETVIDEPLKEIDSTDKLLEDTDKLFRMIETQGVTLPGYLKGRCVEDPGYESIMEDPDHFANIGLKEVLMPRKSEGITRLAIQNVTIDGQSIKEAVIRLSHTSQLISDGRSYRVYQ